MPRIRVDTERLQELARRLAGAAAELRALCGRVGAAPGGLDWALSERGEVDAAAQRACRQGVALASELEGLAGYLERKAAAFAEADAAAEASLGRASAAFLAAASASGSWWLSTAPQRTFPHTAVAQLLALGYLGPGDPPPLPLADLGPLQALRALAAGHAPLSPLPPEWAARAGRAAGEGTEV